MSPGPVILADLGELSKMPPELILDVIDYLDVPSAAKFSQVNRQAQLLLWSDADYRLLRLCLFFNLNSLRHIPEEMKRLGKADHVAEAGSPPSVPSRRFPLEQANYHTLARAYRDFRCFVCGDCLEDLFNFNFESGDVICKICTSKERCYMSFQADFARDSQEMAESQEPRRLPDGQLTRKCAVQNMLDP
ncbi:hypothetical protein F5Y07DRAFT_374598 [Xylaria sp. FL0933]|nr:hypothetical protein F5Y07DRAFT_374598 [Xylaria sp. FL0933]